MRYLFLTYIFIAQLVAAQPQEKGAHEAGFTTVSLIRDERSFNALIYYPAAESGENSVIDVDNGPYPIIGFGHGFFMQNRYYSSLFAHLASHGYIVVAPQFPDVNHMQLAYDLLYCLEYIKTQHGDPGSVFYGLIDITKTGLSGHSMGGGASLLASSIDGSITVVAPLAAAQTNPSAIDAVNKIKAIVYLISAEDDGITPLLTNQLPMYNNSLPVKGLPVIKGANHTKFLDTRLFDFTDPNGNLSATRQLEITRKYLTSVYNLFLKQDTSYFSYAFGKYAQNDDDILFQHELKPLKPLPFGLVNPYNVLLDSLVTFIWNSTYSLNLYDKTEYRLEISPDDNFSNPIYLSELQSDTIHSIKMNNGTYFWRVTALTSDSTFVISDTLRFNVDTTTGLNRAGTRNNKLRLEQNYPNPFQFTTSIEYTIPPVQYFTGYDNGFIPVTLRLYDPSGSLHSILVEKAHIPGNYEIQLEGTRLLDGVYIYELSAGNHIVSRKLTVLK